MYKIVRILLLKILAELLENYTSVYLAALPSTPPSFQNSFNACLKARIVCVGGVNRNCEVLSKLSTWSYRSKLKVRLLPASRQSFSRNFIGRLNCKSLFLNHLNGSNLEPMYLCIDLFSPFCTARIRIQERLQDICWLKTPRSQRLKGPMEWHQS